MDLLLSEHFHLSEFTRSATATARGIDNNLDLSKAEAWQVVNNLRELCIHVLEPLRMHFNTPITIGSGYRCPALNKAVGGAPNSQHLQGLAADLYLPSLAVGREWFTWLMDQDFDYLILERASKTSSIWWIHVSYRKDGNNHHRVIEGLIKSA